MLRVKVRERVGHLVNVSRAPLLAEAAVLGELLVQFARPRKLEHEEYALLVVEVPIQAEDMGVP